jgi:hypothetical protein
LLDWDWHGQDDLFELGFVSHLGCHG